MLFLYILFAILLVILFLITISLLQKGEYGIDVKCSKCGHVFRPRFGTHYLILNYFGRFYKKLGIKFFLRCPKCKKSSWSFLPENSKDKKLSEPLPIFLGGYVIYLYLVILIIILLFIIIDKII